LLASPVPPEWASHPRESGRSQIAPRQMEPVVAVHAVELLFLLHGDHVPDSGVGGSRPFRVRLYLFPVRGDVGE
jgi:hypothetical protein